MQTQKAGFEFMLTSSRCKNTQFENFTSHAFQH